MLPTRAFAASPVPTEPTAVSRDCGRTMVEAVIGLTIVALATVGLARLTTASVRTEGAADRRAVALDIATAELESLIATPFDQLAIDPASTGAVSTYDSLPVVSDPSGFDATVVHDVNGSTFTARRLILATGSPTWHRIVVEVDWAVATDTGLLRLDGSAHSDTIGATP